MPQTFKVEDHDVERVLDHLAKYEGLEHLRARKRADLLTLESGPKTDAIPHTRFRRVSVHFWRVEMPLRGGGWDRTPFRDQLLVVLDLVIETFPWMLAPHD